MFDIDVQITEVYYRHHFTMTHNSSFAELAFRFSPVQLNSTEITNPRISLINYNYDHDIH